MIRVILIDLAEPYRHIDTVLSDLAELKSLVKTYGGVDVASMIQHRARPDKATFIGSGKVQELISLVQKEIVDIVVINAIVNPTQLHHLTELLWTVNPDIQVWDRIDLILNIFERHARSAEAKLQIEIARMQHMGHRIYGLGERYFSRQAGGIGTRGIGQTNIERMKLHLKNQIRIKKDELKKVERQRERQLQRRRENGIGSISIVGYTNAGKTSIFNLLTGKQNEVRDELFVTLDTTTGELPHGKNKKMIVSDTIGFIQNLPLTLFESFRSTLMETVWSDVIIHVIDVSDEKMEEKISAVEQILSDLSVHSKKKIYLFNKIDLLGEKKQDVIQMLKEKYTRYTPHFISIKDGQGVQSFKKALASFS